MSLKLFNFLRIKLVNYQGTQSLKQQFLTFAEGMKLNRVADALVGPEGAFSSDSALRFPKPNIRTNVFHGLHVETMKKNGEREAAPICRRGIVKYNKNHGCIREWHYNSVVLFRKGRLSRDRERLEKLCEPKN